MKKITFAILVLFFSVTGLQAGELSWYPVRLILEGLRQVNGTMESIMTSVSTSGIVGSENSTGSSAPVVRVRSHVHNKTAAPIAPPDSAG